MKSMMNVLHVQTRMHRSLQDVKEKRNLEKHFRENRELMSLHANDELGCTTVHL